LIYTGQSHVTADIKISYVFISDITSPGKQTCFQLLYIHGRFSNTSLLCNHGRNSNTSLLYHNHGRCSNGLANESLHDWGYGSPAPEASGTPQLHYLREVRQHWRNVVAQTLPCLRLPHTKPLLFLQFRFDTGLDTTYPERDYFTDVSLLKRRLRIWLAWTQISHPWLSSTISSSMRVQSDVCEHGVG
jgi:hypothetical protein